MTKPPKAPPPETMNERIVDLQRRVETLENPAGVTLRQLLIITGWVFIVCPLLWSLIGGLLVFVFGWPFAR